MRKVRTIGEPDEVDPDALAAAVRPACVHHGVVLAYLHGRYDAQGPLSDLDVAVLAPELTSRSRLALLDDLVAATRREDLDLAWLDGASDLLRFRVANRGRLLYARSEADRVAFVVAARRAWFDGEPKRRERDRLQRLRIAEGRFGRP